MTIASDSTSLLVPVQLDAWVVTAENQEPLAWYYADYTRLQNFESPIPDPFDTSSASRPAVGIHLHWALPDALTRGRQSSSENSVQFPLVPNRWVVVRFGQEETSRECTIWVVQSDYLSTNGANGTSAFLDPQQASYMDVNVSSGATSINLSNTGLGKSYTIQAWEAMQDPGGPLFLQAVGPGNVSFAAYVPFVQDVFSFVDSDLPPEGTGVYNYTYVVAGYYSDPTVGDPLRGVTTYDPLVWDSESDWSVQTPAQRFTTILGVLNWSINAATPQSPPSTSLYHGQVAQVQWPYTPSNSEDDQQGVLVTVANSSISALATLIESQANVSGEGAAGTALAQLMEAAMLDMLDDYGKPGGSVLIADQIRDSWFGSDPGGIIWSVVSTTPQTSVDSVTTSNLTNAQVAALKSQLAALNQKQQELDCNARVLRSLQSRLYLAWWALAQGTSYGWGEAPTTTPPLNDITAFLQLQLAPGAGTLFSQAWTQYCSVQGLQQKLPNPTDSASANSWAATNWTFPGSPGNVTLADLGLQLKAGTAPRFSHSNDPILLFSGLDRSQKFGEDGRYNEDGTMNCRLPGQFITGISIPDQPAINTQSVSGLINTCATYASIPSIPGLLAESLFTDPGSAPSIAQAVNGDPSAISAAITALLEDESTSATWIGTPPLPFATLVWKQAWVPLFLEWELQFYPTGSGTGTTHQFSLSDWSFDGSEYTWAGTGFDPNYFISYKGRTILTPQAPLFFKGKVEKYLQNNPNIDSAQLEQLIGTVSSWDLLSQSLSGFTLQLETLLAQEAFPPTPVNDMSVSCPAGGTTVPSITALIGDEYRAVPMLEGTGLNYNYFYPVRAGLVLLQKLQIVDTFGQTLQAAAVNTPQGFQPLLGTGLTPTNAPSNLPYGSFQLPPRLVQSARLDISFLANDGSGSDILTSPSDNAVCGWVLPNHLDGSLAIYDQNGVLLGELIAMPAPGNWRPRPGNPGTNPPPATPADIPNATLRQVVESISSQSLDVFSDMLQTIDETLWMVDPLGGRKDQFLSVLIGRPLAVVQTRLQLSLDGLASVNQMWDSMVTPDTNGPPSSYSWLNNDGGVGSLSFPIRLGSLDLRDDGLIGYYLPNASQPYSTFYAVHMPDDLSSGDVYIKPILSNGTYCGDVTLTPQSSNPQTNCAGTSVVVTMLLDPRGSVHAYSGILPTTSAALPASIVEQFIQTLQVTFRTGPIIADPQTLRTPQPAEDHGIWNWIQQSPPGNWETTTIVNADDTAILPSGNLSIRDGWLQLTNIEDN